MNIIVLFGNENCNFFGYKRFFKIYLGSKAEVFFNWCFCQVTTCELHSFTWLIV